MTSESIADLVGAYRAELVAMDELGLGSGREVRARNRHVARMQAAHLRLRETVAGRAAITALIDDGVRTVSIWSATNALAWAPESALAHLEQVAAGDGPGSFEAAMVLREFRGGRLVTDWAP